MFRLDFAPTAINQDASRPGIPIAKNRREGSHRHDASRQDRFSDKSVKQSRFPTLKLADTRDEKTSLVHSACKLADLDGNRVFAEQLGDVSQTLQG